MAEGPYILKSGKLQDASFNNFFFLPHLFGPLRGFRAERRTDTGKNRKTRTVASASSHSTCDTFCLPPTRSELIAFIYKSHATHLAGCLQGVNQLEGLTASGTISENRWRNGHLRSPRIFPGSVSSFPPLSALQLPLPPYLFTVSEFTLERNTLDGRVGN